MPRRMKNAEAEAPIQVTPDMIRGKRAKLARFILTYDIEDTFREFSNSDKWYWFMDHKPSWEACLEQITEWIENKTPLTEVYQELFYLAAAHLEMRSPIWSHAETLALFEKTGEALKAAKADETAGTEVKQFVIGVKVG